MRNIYLLKRIDTGASYYDEYYGFVIRASSAQVARKIASQIRGDEGGDFWLDKSKSSCTIVSVHGPDEIILSDFNAS